MNRNNFRSGAASAARLTTAILAAFVAAPLPAVEATDGHDLLARCRDARQPGACYSELILVADMHDVVAAWGMDAAHWCMPDGVPPQRLREVVLTALEDPAREPKSLAAPSARLVAEAYARAFPCGERH